MRPRMSKPEMLKHLAEWAMAKNIPMPKTPQDTQQVIGAFMRDGGPLWRAVGVSLIPTHDPVGQLLGHDLVSHDPITEIEDHRPLDVAGDDFDELVHERNTSMYEAGGDDLAREAIMQQRIDAARQAQAPFIQHNPPSVGKAVLGTSVTVVSPDGTGFASPQIWGGDNSAQFITTPITPFTQACSWQGDDTETRAITVSVAPSARGQTTRPVGWLQWGTRAVTNSVFFDIGNGVQACVFGSSAFLQVGADGATGKAGVSQPLSATMSFTPSASPLPLYRTWYLDKMSGTLIRLAVPPFAKRVSFWSADATVSVKLTIRDVNFTDISTFTTTAGVLMTPLLLPGDAFDCKVTLLAGPTVQGRLIYELNF